MDVRTLSIFRSASRAGASSLAAVALLAAGAAAQGAPPKEESPATADLFSASPSLVLPEDREGKWGFDVSALTNNPPTDDAYLIAVARADRDNLHLEGRWNYEDEHTGSLWAGWNFDWPAKEEKGFGFKITPMVGVVAGETAGFSLGEELGAKVWIVDFYNETEYLFSNGQSGGKNDFLYSWSELAITPLEFLRAGIVAQRTNVFNTTLSVDRGVFAGAMFKRIRATLYWFNPTSNHNSYVMFGVGFGF